jgi:hypothetical protein
METARQELGQAFDCDQNWVSQKRIKPVTANVSHWPKADVAVAPTNVCFRA